MRQATDTEAPPAVPSRTDAVRAAGVAGRAGRQRHRRRLPALLLLLGLPMTAAAQSAADATDKRAVARALARDNVSYLLPFASDPAIQRFLTEEALPYFDLNRVIAISTEAYLTLYTYEELLFLRNALQDPVARRVLMKANDMSRAVAAPVQALLIDAIRCTPLAGRPPALASYGTVPPAERDRKC